MSTAEKTTTLEALLRRWAELEPDACEYDTDLGCYSVVVGDLWIPLDNWHTKAYTAQAATQEAIERRGLHWSVWTNPSDTREPPYGAAVWVDLSDEETDRYGADTPAAALLSAYVQALEGLG